MMVKVAILYVVISNEPYLQFIVVLVKDENDK
jgi:hypothetical protein